MSWRWNMTFHWPVSLKMILFYSRRQICAKHCKIRYPENVGDGLEGLQQKLKINSVVQSMSGNFLLGFFTTWPIICVTQTRFLSALLVRWGDCRVLLKCEVLWECAPKCYRSAKWYYQLWIDMLIISRHSSTVLLYCASAASSDLISYSSSQRNRLGSLILKCIRG